jgi:hypothetical protein
MSPAIAFPDPLFDVRYWLRNLPQLASLSGNRVFFRYDEQAQTPFLQLMATFDAPDPDAEVPMSELRVAVHAWGKDGSEYPLLRQIVSALKDACWRLQTTTLINPTGNSIVHNVRFDSAVDIPDPVTGAPRIVMSLVFTMRTNLYPVV